ncbi:MAG: hypothetical protein LBI56_00275, partial [Puniceicoccales bacterium]|nr:hypothetical protein [Puniceicoccales bacterium]
PARISTPNTIKYVFSYHLFLRCLHCSRLLRQINDFLRFFPRRNFFPEHFREFIGLRPGIFQAKFDDVSAIAEADFCRFHAEITPLRHRPQDKLSHKNLA